ncbi:MAG: hypothetical protein AABX83_03890 [Nanoarchaeota archaeon]
MKLKLKPSARMNRHYILLEAKSKKEVEQAILDYIGILGWAKASPIFINDKNKIILSIDRKEMINVRAAFELSNSDIKVLRVSGTLKGL